MTNWIDDLKSSLRGALPASITEVTFDGVLLIIKTETLMLNTLSPWRVKHNNHILCSYLNSNRLAEIMRSNTIDNVELTGDGLDVRLELEENVKLEIFCVNFIEPWTISIGQRANIFIGGYPL